MTEATSDATSGPPRGAGPDSAPGPGVPMASPMVKTSLPGRSCGTCTLCCKILEIPSLNKPRGVWCRHCDPGVGCMAYSTRPRECASFFCAYLTNAELDESWKPSRSKIVVTFEPAFNRIAAYVDPQRPDAWKKEPYYSRLKEWARAAVPRRGQVVTCIGTRTYIVFPDRDVDLGDVGRDELIVINEKTTPLGVRLEAFKIHKDDPRARSLPGA